jgi:rSAM/selenodomain-associated transferase 1
MPEIAVGLMAKYPEKGRVKTRLAEQTDTDTAFRIYEQLLSASVRMVVGLETDLYHRAVFVTPENMIEPFADGFPGFDEVLPQRGVDLGERMLDALVWLLRSSDVRRAILIGADIPDVNVETLEDASRLLSDSDLVLGPTHDGGYYLVGLEYPVPAIFSGIEWGTPTVFRRTVAAAESAGLEIGLLPTLRDLDNFEDMQYFRRIGRIS